MKRLIIDLDNTLTIDGEGAYSARLPRPEIVSALREYHRLGFDIVIHTSRNMRKFENNVGKIVANTAPIIIEWLRAQDIPYDEIWVGKPWCGTDGFYVDDRAIRPSEFALLSYGEVRQLLNMDDLPDMANDPE
jgi:capsule biosynthesis phosphatase